MKKKEKTFEERLARLQSIVAALESGSISLEDSVALYKEGLALAAVCREQLEKARNDIQLCSEGILSPFEPEGEEEE